MLDVRRLHLLRELSLRGTIAAVAEALAYTPSAVSQQLSALEKEAGVPLLERTGRRVVLTPAGANLVRHAEAVLERLEVASAELADARHGLAGPLRIGSFPTATRLLVLPAVTHLLRRHPRLEPMVLESDPAEAADRLRAGELDLALVHEYELLPAVAASGIRTRPLCAEAMYLASTQAAPTDRPTQAPDTARELDSLLTRFADSAWITATPGTLCRELTIQACRAAGFTPRVRHQIDDFDIVLALVADGQGVALVPQFGIHSPVPDDVVLSRLPVRRKTLIAYRAGASRHPAVDAAVESLRAVVPPEPREPKLR